MENHFRIELNFPAMQTTKKCDSADSSLVSKALNGTLITELKTTAGGDILIELPTGKDVADLQPSLDEIERFPGRGVIVTSVASPESGFSFISRFFCPNYGIPEDPVCGSLHCALATYWSGKLHKNLFVAYQASKRGGALELSLDEENNRVHLKRKSYYRDGRLPSRLDSEILHSIQPLCMPGMHHILYHFNENPFTTDRIGSTAIH